MKNKKGFTLIELLAIIVILAIVAVITIPIILNIIENSRKGAAKDSAYGFKDSINKYYLGRLSSTPNYNMPDGIYTVNGTTGYLEGTEDLVGTELQVQVSGQKPSGGSIELEKNSIKQACIKFGEYAVSITNGAVGEAQKASCNGTLVGASDSEDTPTRVTAAQTILNENGETKGYLTETQLANETNKAEITKPVKIVHPAITENTATGSTIPALTSYRYMGKDPDNWIYFNCSDYSEDAQSKTNCELWRIISIENGQLKITADNIITDGPWDYGQVNHGGVCVNDWATSDLNYFLNGKYLTGTVAVNYSKNGKEIAIDNKAYLELFYNNFRATSSGTKGKQHGLLNPATVGMIADSTWYLGGRDTSKITAAQAYAMERGNATGNKENFDFKTFVNSGVAIISPSDYGYASSECYSGSNLYNYSTCTSSNWMYTGATTWMLSPWSGYSGSAWMVSNGGYVYDYGYDARDKYGVRPVVYLNSNIGISGTGASSDPYKIIK